MDSTMNIPAVTRWIACTALVLIGTMQAASAQNIYKCTHGGRVEYTDHPCPGASGELIHQADDSEVIDQYLDLGQDAVARRYAQSRHLDGLYEARLKAHQQRMEERAQRQADEAVAAKQREFDAHQQALADEAANRDRLQAENDALRQQNDQLRDQAAQPVEPYAPNVWAPPYREHAHDHDHQPPQPPQPPVFHPCRQLAGGRVEC
jgi:hypothetical protein